MSYESINRISNIVSSREVNTTADERKEKLCSLVFEALIEKSKKPHTFLSRDYSWIDDAEKITHLYECTESGYYESHHINVNIQYTSKDGSTKTVTLYEESICSIVGMW